MWQGLAEIVALPNFIQGGMTIVALSLMGMFVYMTKAQNNLTRTLVEQLKSSGDAHAEQLKKVADEATKAIKADTISHVELAKSLTRHSSTIESFGRIIERKI